MYDILQSAVGLYGLKEVPGKESNEKLLRIIKSEVSWVQDDSDIAWCAIFITYLFRLNCYDHFIPDKPYAARSWAHVGSETTDPMPGDLVVFWRESPTSWKGHVALFVNFDGDKVRVLGGNQNNAINITSYSRSRILAIRTI